MFITINIFIVNYSVNWAHAGTTYYIRMTITYALRMCTRASFTLYACVIRCMRVYH